MTTSTLSLFTLLSLPPLCKPTPSNRHNAYTQQPRQPQQHYHSSHSFHSHFWRTITQLVAHTKSTQMSEPTRTRQLSDSGNTHASVLRRFSTLKTFPAARHPHLQNQVLAAASFVKRLEEQSPLTGHLGCVNTIAWDETGEYLVSGSGKSDAHSEEQTLSLNCHGTNDCRYHAF